MHLPFKVGAGEYYSSSAALILGYTTSNALGQMSLAASQGTIMTDTDAGRHPTNITTSISNVIKSPLTEFTKRRDWQQRILEKIPDFLYVLALDGKILYASPSCISITGYPSTQLTGRFIRAFIHPDDADIFDKEIDDSIATGSPLRFFYRFRKPDGSWIVFESHGHAHCSKGHSPSSMRGGSIHYGGFFIMSRPYLNKSAALMDSFLEHKIENIRLTSRLRELRDEEQECLEPQAWQENTLEGKFLTVLSIMQASIGCSLSRTTSIIWRIKHSTNSTNLRRSACGRY
jgi:PAS domain S-box-containing protein